MRGYTVFGWAAVAAVCHADRFYHQIVRRDSASFSISLNHTSTTTSSQSSSSTQSLSQSSSSSSSSISSTHSSSTTSSSNSTSSSSFSATITSSSITTNSTTSPNATTPAPTACTGCILQAWEPETLTWSGDGYHYETEIRIIGTVVPLVVQYEDGFLTTVTTVYPTPTPANTSTPTPAGEYVTERLFSWEIYPEVFMTGTSGTTYLAYTNIRGGADKLSTFPVPTCVPTTGVIDLFPPPDGEYDRFVQTLTGPAPPVNSLGLIPLPPNLIEYIEGQPQATKYFSKGQDLATCTLGTRRPDVPQATPSAPPAETHTGPAASQSTKTLISSSLATETTMHIQGSGRLRNPERPEMTPGLIVPLPEPPKPEPPKPEPPKPEPPKPIDSPQPVEQPKPPTEQLKQPDLPELIVSALQGLNNPSVAQPGQTAPANNPGQSVTIGDSVLPIHPAQPTSPLNPQNPQDPQNPPNPQQPGIVIGSQTIAPGEVKTINGVVVSVPTNGGGSVVVGGSTFAVNPANPANPTGPAVLTVGNNVVTANSNGQFVVGTQTLNPGGPAIVISGTTLSLGPSGTVAVVNGATQVLGNAPLITGAPALTVNGKVIPATVVGGTTGFVVAPGQTLTPGGVLVVAGTTYSLPAGGSGSTVVVNGVTQTLANAPGLPVLSLNGQSVSATVVGGTTAFVVAPGQTLTPGGTLVVSGTTLSMPVTASGSVVVINGVTSTLGKPGPITAAPALTVDGKTYSASVVDGTTQYVLGPGTTLKPGQAVTVSGSTISLDPSGTALVINGKTSTIPKTPASNTASTTGSTSTASSSGSSKKPSSSGTSRTSSTTQRAPGNFIASGIGITSKKGAAPMVRPRGFDVWLEGMVVGVAGWLLMFL